MAEQISVKVAGASRTVTQPSVKIAGTWRAASNVWVRVGGSWRHAWPAVGTGTPVVSAPIPNQSATDGVAFSYTFPAGSFTDPDFGSLTYSATPLPAGITFNPAARTFSGTPAGAGTTSVVVTATDSSNQSASDTFDIVVAAVSRTQTVFSQDDFYAYLIAVSPFSNSGGFVNTGTRQLFRGANFSGGRVVWAPPFSNLEQGILGGSEGTLAGLLPLAIISYIDQGSDARADIEVNTPNPPVGARVALAGLLNSQSTITGTPSIFSGNVVFSGHLDTSARTFTVQADRTLRDASGNYLGAEGAAISNTTDGGGDVTSITYNFTRFVAPASWVIGSTWTRTALDSRGAQIFTRAS